MDILDDMGVSKLSAKVFFKVNYSFKAFICLEQVAKWDYRVCWGNETSSH